MNIMAKNITVKVPKGEKPKWTNKDYDVDIVEVREKYVEWRLKMIAIAIIYLLAFLWALLFLTSFRSSGFLPPFSIFLGAVFLKYVLNKKIHFECPYSKCNTEIRVYEPWICKNCKEDDNVTPPALFRTFFDTCKKGHKPQSYKCPTCQNVFELFPGGRTDKYAREASTVHQAVQAPQQLEPPGKSNSEKTGEFIPRIPTSPGTSSIEVSDEYQS
jgi:hypothetical protein